MIGDLTKNRIQSKWGRVLLVNRMEFGSDSASFALGWITVLEDAVIVSDAKNPKDSAVDIVIPWANVGGIVIPVSEGTGIDFISEHNAAMIARKQEK